MIYKNWRKFSNFFDLLWIRNLKGFYIEIVIDFSGLCMFIYRECGNPKFENIRLEKNLTYACLKTYFNSEILIHEHRF